jgi:hypothetical protein
MGVTGQLNFAVAAAADPSKTPKIILWYMAVSINWEALEIVLKRCRSSEDLWASDDTVHIDEV